MTEATTSEVRLDAHSIEPIPSRTRTPPASSSRDLAGANIVRSTGSGGPGDRVGLGLVETVLIVVLGNLVGCAIFAAMTVMGHKTGVNQMVLSRSAFGRRAATCRRGSSSS